MALELVYRYEAPAESLKRRYQTNYEEIKEMKEVRVSPNAPPMEEIFTKEKDKKTKSVQKTLQLNSRVRWRPANQKITKSTCQQRAIKGGKHRDT